MTGRPPSLTLLPGRQADRMPDAAVHGVRTAVSFAGRRAVRPASFLWIHQMSTHACAYTPIFSHSKTKKFA